MKITTEQLQQLTGLESADAVTEALRAMGVETEDPAPYVPPTMTPDDLIRSVLMHDAGPGSWKTSRATTHC